MIESAVIRELRSQFLTLDPDHTGILTWTSVNPVLHSVGIDLTDDNLQLITQCFSDSTGIRYQELLRNLHASLCDGVRTWRVYRPAYTFESRNLRESDGNTLVRKTVLSPVRPVEQKAPSLMTQLQSENVDYLSLGLARENFKRLDLTHTGQLTPTAFESCFRGRNISPFSVKLLTTHSLDHSGNIDFSRFNQIVEKYKFAPVKVSPRRKESADHYGKLNVEGNAPNKRLAGKMEELSMKLKAKYRSAAAAFRAFSHGQGLTLHQFSSEVDNLGVDISSSDMQELFAYISQGDSDLGFEGFNAVYEASRPVKVPRMSLTPQRLIPIQSIPSDRTPTLTSKRHDVFSHRFNSDFGRNSPKKRQIRRRIQVK